VRNEVSKDVMEERKGRKREKSSESAQKPEVRSKVPWGSEQQIHSPVIPNFALNVE